MITPAYSLTSTERVLPRMALDFTTGTLDPRVSVTRALNTATAVNSSGFIAVVNANLPRFDYDPATLAPKGLLIEEARTNALLYSQEFDNIVWGKIAATVTANSTTSPDGTTNADTLVESATTDTHYAYIAPILLAGTNTLSLYYKISSARKIALYHTNTNTGRQFDATGNQSAGLFNAPSGGATVVAAGNGWYRATITITATVGANEFRLWMVRASDDAINYAGDGTSGINIFGAQLEAGAFATSYIPTTTTSLTRNADYVTMTGTNFSDWYNQSEGAFQIEASATIPASGSQTFIAVSDNTPNNYIGPYMLNVLGYVYHKIVTLGVSQCEFAAAVGVTNNSIFKYAFCYKLNSAQIAVNTVLGAGDTSVSVPTVTLAEIGSRASSSQMNGHMRKISYWPQRLLDQELQAFSK
jgi:hypothetical protein